MEWKEKISELRGVLAVSTEEGRQLGTVSAIFFDTEQKALTALGLRPRPMGRMSFVSMNDVMTLGEEVVFIGSASSVTATEPPGPARNLKNLQGHWVTTQAGVHLGPLIDLDIDQKTWKITELRLADSRHLPVDADEITIGRDEIIVPVSYVDRVVGEPAEKVGVFGRMFGSERLDDLSSVMRRVKGNSDEGSKSDDEPETKD